MSSTSKVSASALIISASDKAGMEGIERSRINSIILRESGKSSFMIQQQKKDENVNERIEKMKEKLICKKSHSSFISWSNENNNLTAKINSLIQKRRKISTHVVIDMDSFYISCELLSKPELKDVPACVGGSMVLTSNYCARRYGVRSAMAGFIADKLVQELSNGKEKLIHLPANFKLYTEMSQKMQHVLSEYDPNLKSYSLDEVYLNLEPYLNLRIGKGWSHERSSAFLSSHSQPQQSQPQPNPTTTTNLETFGTNQTFTTSSDIITIESISIIISEMRSKVEKYTGGLTCSAGVAPNFLLAKIASDMKKPNGQLCITHNHDHIMKFMHQLPVRKISGIGRVTEKILHAFQITTGGDLFKHRGKLQFLFPPATAHFLLKASLGWDDDSRSRHHHGNDNDVDVDNNDAHDVNMDEEEIQRKGLSRERTFAPEGIYVNIQQKLLNIIQLVVNDMKDRNLMARTLTMKVKLKTFEVFSKSKSLPYNKAYKSIQDIRPMAFQLLNDIQQDYQQQQQQQQQQPKNKRKKSTVSFMVRLLGIRCSNFLGEREQKYIQQIQNMGIEKYIIDKSSLQSKEMMDSNVKKKQPSILQENVVHSINEDNTNSSPIKANGSTSPKSNISNRNKIMDYHLRDCSSKANIYVSSLTSTPRKQSTINIQKLSNRLIKNRDDHNKVTPTVAAVASSITKQSSTSIWDNKTQASCPICHQFFSFGIDENDLLNQHVDACLNGSTIRQMIRQRSNDYPYDLSHKHVTKRRKDLHDFFGGNQELWNKK